MKYSAVFRVILSVLAASAAMVSVAIAKTQPVVTPPEWAYPVNPPSITAAPVDDTTLRRVPGSTVTYSLPQVRDLFSAPDWHPGDHPPLPKIVSEGRRPDVYACGFCHRADGAGAPENSSLAGLPEAYIIQQVADIKSGARKTSVPVREPTRLMTSLSKAATAKEIREAAAYFSALKPKKNIRVIETDSAPKTFVTGWHLAASPSGGKELLGQRIIEVPESLEHFISRDARAMLIAYVPTGSVAKGRALAETGGKGKTVACAACHGAGLKGMAQFPGIAGRSPTYIVRQLYDFKHGARKGSGAAMMQPTVEKLGIEDVVNLAAYLATLAP
jgi:cytochrome c553